MRSLKMMGAVTGNNNILRPNQLLSVLWCYIHLINLNWEYKDLAKIDKRALQKLQKSMIVGGPTLKELINTEAIRAEFIFAELVFTDFVRIRQN